MKIVVRTPNWVGDAVLALPAVDSLRANFPEAKITLCAGDWVRGIYAPENGGIDVLPANGVKTWRDLKTSAAALRERGFDVGLLLTNSFGSALEFFRARIPERWGYRRDGRRFLLTKAVPPPDPQAEPRHHVYYYLQLLEKLGLRTATPVLRLRIPDEEALAAAAQLEALGVDPRKPLVLMNAGASFGPAKRWPATRFAELAGRLRTSRGAQVVLTGAAEEEDLASAVTAAEPKTASLVGRTSLRRLLAVIGKAALFITNDTGPMHMANALRVPVVALFGPTEPLATAPFHPPAAVLRKPVPCGPCLYRTCPYDHRCMTAISVEEAYEACAALLA